jgi:serine/threonine protein kinase
MHQSGQMLDTERLLGDYPECRETILGFDPNFETLVATLEDGFETQLAQTKALDHSEATTSVVTSRSGYPQIPGFEILSELGRGGMGIVYRARQNSANRQVALKVVRSEMLDTSDLASRANALERFRTEAKAAASLQHDNIIPVYEVGEVPAKDTRQSPLRYYAMRFIQGTSLYDILRKGPLDGRRAARYIVQIARALQAAHDQGILHRDIKPHNVMIETATDRPLIADFGLAKFVHNDNSLTHAGQIIGTPSYMSPEQAQDASGVKAAADQYSLGATLYHLLAGHPPFAAPSLQEIIRQILDRPPVSLRESNPSIDRDLETICMKAIEKEPSKRYGSCQEFAEDLQRYIEGRPIVARPVSTFERGWRWCRRNPVLAGMMLAVSLLALTTFGAIAIGYRQTAQALSVSESRLEKAFQVVDDLFTRISEDELLNEPGMQKLRSELLQKALVHYEYFLSESKKYSTESDPKLLSEIGKSNYRLATIQQLMGNMEIAKEALHDARVIQQKLLDQDPENIDRLKSLADTLNSTGSLASNMGDHAVALEAFEQAHRYREKLVSKFPDQLAYQMLACNTTMNIGIAKVQLMRLEEGLEDLDKSQSKRLELRERYPDSAKLQQDIARGWYGLGKLTFDIKPRGQVTGYLIKSVESFRRSLELDSRSLSNQYQMINALWLLGESYTDGRETPQALEVLQEAQVMSGKLAEANSEVLEFQMQLGHIERSLGRIYYDKGEWSESERSWKKALSITRSFMSHSPESDLLLDDLVTSLCALGDLEVMRGEDKKAMEYRQEAMLGLKRLSKNRPEDSWYREQLDATGAWIKAQRQ